MKLFFTIFFLLESKAYAYIDPASGTILSNILVILLLPIFFKLQSLYQLAASYFIIVSKRINTKKNYDIVFHIENNIYYDLFEEIIEKSKHLNLLIISPKNNLIKFNRKNITIITEEKLFYQLGISRFVRANFFITSTPGLNTNYFHKNKKIKKYIHICHSSMDVHVYQIFSFDNFDFICCPTIHFQNNLIKLLKQRYGFCKPKIILTDLFYLNKKLTYKKESLNKNKPNLLTVAPTWGDDSLLYKINEEFIHAIKKLASKKKLIINFRPHPQTYISDKEKLNNIFKLFKKFKLNYCFDNQSDNFKSLFNSRILICDISGVFSDYLILNNNPKILVHGMKKKKRRLYENHFLNEEKRFELLFLKRKKCIFFNMEELVNRINSKNELKTIKIKKDFFKNKFGNNFLYNLIH